jgi:hypothetical protein
MKMTEKRAETATPHLREAPEQQQQVEHEDAILLLLCVIYTSLTETLRLQC